MSLRGLALSTQWWLVPKGVRVREQSGIDPVYNELEPKRRCEMTSLNSLIEPFAQTMGGPIRALRAVMAERGWIDEEAIVEVAEIFNLSRAEVRGIVSFYSDFRTSPPPARTLKLCRAEACQARGARAVCQALESETGQRIGEAHEGAELEIEAVHCLGLCAHGPVAWEGDHFFVGLRASDAKDLASGALSGLAWAAATSLDDASPEWLEGQTRLIFERAEMNDPLDLDAYLSDGGFSTLARDGNELLLEIEASGLRGRGGAGFPAAIKWRTVASQATDTKYVVCNADEGDSGTFADRLIMERAPYLLLEGMALAAKAVGARQGFIYLRSEYPKAALVLEEALVRLERSGLLKDQLQVELFIGAGAYICGEETSLLESLEGRRGLIRAKPPLPAISGLKGQPTLVHNVVTLSAVPWIVRYGGERYRALGVGASTGTMPFQLSGNVKKGGIVEVPFGMTVRTLVETFGGGTQSGRPIGAIQVGGPLGAYLLPEQFDTPLTYEAMSSIGAGIGHGGLVVFDDQVDLIEQARYAFAFCELESCGKCTPCRLGATRGKELIEDIQREGPSQEKIRLLDDLCEVMTHASLCQLGGMTPIPVRSALGPMIDAVRQEDPS